MMTKAPWQLYFKNQLKGAESLYSQEATEVSLLLFCLRAKIIPVAEYLHWACNHYQVPVLSKDFFTQHPPSPKLFKKFQGRYPWTQEFLPIAEWDGLPVIAGLEVPESMNFPAVFVLTSHEELESAWASYNNASKKSETSEFSDMTAFAATVVAKESHEDLFGQDGELILKEDSSPDSESLDNEENSENNGESSGEEESSSDTSEEADGIPDGLFGDSISINAPAPALSFGGLTAKKIEPIVPAIPEEHAFESVDVPVIAPEPPIDPPEEIETVHVEADAMHAEIPRKGPRTSRIVIDTLPTEEDTSVDVKVPLPKVEVPKAPIKLTQPPIDSPVAYFLEKVRKQNKENFDKEVLTCFNQFKTFFKKSMLLAIGDKDRVVKPIMWEGGNYDVRKPSIIEFNLKTPSVFRIVSGTQKPYHGYIVLNDLNESFFESWNHGQIPDHITIIPLMDHDLVVGMLMGLGEKSCYNKNVLQFSENAAKDLSLKIFKPAAKAA